MPKCVILMLADFCFITTPAVAVCQICHVLSSFVTLHYCFSACLWNSAFGFLSRHFIGTSMTLISTKVAFLLTMEAMFKSSAVIAKLFLSFFSHVLTATCTGVLFFLTAECVDAAFFRHRWLRCLLVVSGISCWNHTGALLSCTRIRCVISVSGLLLPVCLSLVQLVLKGSWSNLKTYEELIVVLLSLMTAL